MSVRLRLAMYCMLSLALSGAAAAGKCQDASFPSKLTLYPADEPKPAMKYRLLPPYPERTPGNAAVFYGKVKAENDVFFGNRELQIKIADQWQTMPLSELLLEDVRVVADRTGVVRMIDQAARCDFCDWQLPLRESTNPLEMLLSEAQELRGFGRILGANARVHIAYREYDEAVRSLRNGYAMGRHVAQGATIVNSMIGVAICGLMHQQVVELIQQPGAPNLYWALTSLPQPLIDPTDGLNWEAVSIERAFPEMKDVERATRTADEWQAVLHRLARIRYGSGGLRRPGERFSIELFEAEVERQSPAVKQSLIEHGLPQPFVESLSKYQAALILTVRTHRNRVNDGLKFFALPLADSIRGLDAALEQAELEPELIPVGTMSLGGIRNARIWIARNERQIAFYRTLEALRLYAARNRGRLPASLDQLTDAPAPNDPATGAPFVYRVENDKATISGPALPASAPSPWAARAPEPSISCEITIARP